MGTDGLPWVVRKESLIVYAGKLLQKVSQRDRVQNVLIPKSKMHSEIQKALLQRCLWFVTYPRNHLQPFFQRLASKFRILNQDEKVVTKDVASVCENFLQDVKMCDIDKCRKSRWPTWQVLKIEKEDKRECKKHPTPTQEQECPTYHHPEGERIRNCAIWQQKDGFGRKVPIETIVPRRWGMMPESRIWWLILNCNVIGAYPRVLSPSTEYLDDVWPTRSSL